MTTSKTDRCWLAACAAVLLLGFVLRVAFYRCYYGHPDEPITSEVVRHLRTTHDWDTNWAKAALDPHQKYDQYNFSSYHYAAYLFVRATEWVPWTGGWRALNDGDFVFRFFSVLLGTVVVAQTLWLGRRAGGWIVAVAAGLFTAVAVPMVQDAHYARPEAFAAVLTLWAIALCWPEETLRPRRVAAAGVVIGLLVACKISMLMLIWLPLVPWFAARNAGARRPVILALIVAAMAAGFALGVPGAVLHPKVYAHGVRHLMEQYAGLHPPHSHLSGKPTGDLLMRYIVTTFGVALVGAGLTGAFVLAWRRQWAHFALLAGPILCFGAYFATRSVFFERNITHIVPLLLVLAAMGVNEAALWVARGAGIRQVAVAALVVGGLLVRPAMMVWKLDWVEFSRQGLADFNAFEAITKARLPGTQWKETMLLTTAPLDELAAQLRANPVPVLLRVTDYSDEWTAASLAQLQQRFDAKVVADFPGSFPEVSSSTLQAYLSPRYRYFLVTAERGR